MANKASGISDDFLGTLREKYLLLSNGEKDWSEENSPLREILPLIEADLSPRYKILTPLGVGGTGVIVKIEDTNLGINCALKFPRPKIGKETLFVEIIESEISKLLETRHPNIIQVYYQGNIKYRKVKYPYYIMEYISDAQDGLDFFSRQPRDAAELLQILRQIVEGIGHLHRIGIVHLDIKLENMLVSSDGRAVISDLGSARSVGPSLEQTVIFFTRQYAHPELISLRIYSSTPDPNRIKGEVERSKIRPEFDLYALGKNLRRVLQLHDRAKWKGLDSYTRKYLELMACRLLDGRNTDDECAIGLPRVAFSEIKYKDIFEVTDDIRKLRGDYPLHRIIPEMDEHVLRWIQTSSLSPTPFTTRLSKIIAHPALRRLSGISQLGLVNLVYPTATHSRLEHVLGTFSNTVRYCDELYHDPVNPLGIERWGQIFILDFGITPSSIKKLARLLCH